MIDNEDLYESEKAKQRIAVTLCEHPWDRNIPDGVLSGLELKIDDKVWMYEYVSAVVTGVNKYLDCIVVRYEQGNGEIINRVSAKLFYDGKLPWPDED